MIFNGKLFEVRKTKQQQQPTRMDVQVADIDFFTSASPSSPTPSPSLHHCDYSDWSPSLSIIPSVYLLAFMVGGLGNSLVLWAYLDPADGRRTKAGDRGGCDSLPPRKQSGGKPSGGRRSCWAVSSSSRSSSDSSSSSSSALGPPACPRRPSRPLTNSLIASLALADLCFLVTLPLWAAYTALGFHWPFGQPLCRLSSFLTALNMYASVFSLSVLSVERYWVLTGRRPPSHHHRHRHHHPHRALWILGGVWLLAGLLALPGLLLRSVREVEADYDLEDDLHPAAGSGSVVLSCQMDYSVLIGPGVEETEQERAETWWAAALSIKSTLMGFLLPLLVLLLCYCSLARLLRQHFGRGPRPDRRRQRRLLRVIVSLVLAFFLCWLPLHVNKSLSVLLELGLLPHSCPLEQLLLAAQPYVTCLAYLNSCLNPLLYAACDPAFRRRCRGAIATAAMLCCCVASGRREERRGEGRGGGGGAGEEEEAMEGRSSAFPSKTQEETADRTEGAEEEEEEEVGKGVEE